jgi:hypothetical protein
MSAVLIPETLTVSYTTATFSPPNVGPIATISAVLTGAIAGNTVTLSVPLAATSVSTSLQADVYTWTISNLDAAGNTYGGPFTGSFTVSAPTTVTLSLASGLTLN